MRTPLNSIPRTVRSLAFLVALLACSVPAACAATVRPAPSPAVYPDGNAAERMPAGVKSHMNRDVGLTWLDLPLMAPTTD